MIACHDCLALRHYPAEAGTIPLTLPTLGEILPSWTDKGGPISPPPQQSEVMLCEPCHWWRFNRRAVIEGKKAEAERRRARLDDDARRILAQIAPEYLPGGAKDPFPKSPQDKGPGQQ